MSRTTTHADWLRRISDYHTGTVNEAERAAVEAHLAGCAECQEALAMYRRFYSLLRSPLRLGPPMLAIDEEPTLIGGAPPPPISYDATQPPQYSSYPPSDYPQTPQPFQPPRPPRRRVLAGIAAVLAATLVVVGFVAVYASRNFNIAASPTPTAQAAVSPSAAVSPTAQATATAQASTFVCANPSGSDLTYAYMRGDHNLYLETGCANPVQMSVPAYSTPLAWSPGNRYLAISAPGSVGNYSLVIYDPGSQQTITTSFPTIYPSDGTPGQIINRFLGWVDDSTFLEALQPVAGNNDPNAPFGPSTIVKVDVVSQARTTVGTVTWFADTQIIAPGFLFYGGYQSKSEGQAYLHRLSLNDGSDTKLVALGEYGNGGCQGTMFCNWTAPWVVTPDGVNVLYHNPGPTSFPSDTNVVKDTPLVFARLDGSIPSTPFGTQPADALSTPGYSPGGRYAIASGTTDQPNATDGPWFRLLQIGGTATDVQGYFIAFRGDNQAMVIGKGNVPQPYSYDLSSHTTTPLEEGSGNYLWAHSG